MTNPQVFSPFGCIAARNRNVIIAPITRSRILQMEIEESGRWKATSDNGTVHTVIEYQAIEVFRPISGPSTRLKGVRSLYLSDGRAVNYIDADTFQIVDTDEVIRKVI